MTTKDADWNAAESFAKDPDAVEVLYDDRERPHRRINVELLAAHIAAAREAGAKEERTRIVAIIDKLSDGYFRAMVNDEAAGDDKGAGICQKIGRALCDLSSSLEQPATKQESDRDA